MVMNFARFCKEETMNDIHSQDKKASAAATGFLTQSTFDV